MQPHILCWAANLFVCNAESSTAVQCVCGAAWGLVAWLSKRRQEGVCLWVTSSWRCFNECDEEDESALISVDLLNHCGLSTHTWGGCSNMRCIFSCSIDLYAIVQMSIFKLLFKIYMYTTVYLHKVQNFSQCMLWIFSKKVMFKLLLNSWDLAKSQSCTTNMF